jgi:hypothetical protein
MRRIAWLAVMSVLIAGGCGDDGPARDQQGNISDTGNASVFTFRAGDCFDDPSGDPSQVEELAAVPCTQPHDNEIYYTFDLTDSDFPGQDAMTSAAFDECLGDAFTAYVGISWEETALDVFPVLPTEVSWGSGDRTVYCVVFNPDYSKLEGSVKGSGR